MIKRTFAITDIHGCLKAFKTLLKEVEFDYKNDKLICIGDTCDRGSNVKECFDELFKIKNLVYILGNHDDWALSYFLNSLDKDDGNDWWNQGGKETMDSFENIDILPYAKFLKEALPYYVDEQNRLFVHGGFDPDIPIRKHSKAYLIWDRGLIFKAKGKQTMHDIHGCSNKIKPYKEIFIGHTPVSSFSESLEPIRFANVYDIDTGVVFDGRLTLLNIETKKFIQSNKKGELVFEGQI